MLSESLLQKIRIGAVGIGASIVFSAAHPLYAADSTVSAAACSTAAALTETDLNTLRAMIPKMGALDYEARQQASYAVLALGQKVTEYLSKELTVQTDEEIRERLRILIDTFNPKPEIVTRVFNGCMGKCGRG
jgi:hypothetical protein